MKKKVGGREIVKCDNQIMIGRFSPGILIYMHMYVLRALNLYMHGWVVNKIRF